MKLDIQAIRQLRGVFGLSKRELFQEILFVLVAPCAVWWAVSASGTEAVALRTAMWMIAAGALVFGVFCLLRACSVYRFDGDTVAWCLFDRFPLWTQPLQEFHSADLSDGPGDHFLRLESTTGTRLIFAPRALAETLGGEVGREREAQRRRRVWKAYGVTGAIGALVATYFLVKSAALYYREWALERSYAVTTASAVRVESAIGRSGCTTNVWIEFRVSPLGAKYTYFGDLYFLGRPAPIGFLDTDDADCSHIDWRAGDTLEIAYVPHSPSLNRPYWGKLDRGSESFEWAFNLVAAGVFALCSGYLLFAKHRQTA